MSDPHCIIVAPQVDFCQVFSSKLHFLHSKARILCPQNFVLWLSQTPSAPRIVVKSQIKEY